MMAFGRAPLMRCAAAPAGGIMPYASYAAPCPPVMTTASAALDYCAAPPPSIPPVGKAMLKESAMHMKKVKSSRGWGGSLGMVRNAADALFRRSNSPSSAAAASDTAPVLDFSGGALEEESIMDFENVSSAEGEAVPAMVPRPKGEASASPGVCAALPPEQVLSLLNQSRLAAGYIPATKQVLEALAGKAWELQCEAEQAASAGGPAAAAAGLYSRRSLAAVSEDLCLGASARPKALASDDAWATVLALAYLRKHMAGERGVWVGLEAKALEWLSAVWPEAVGRSIGSVVLAAMRLV